MCALWLFIKYEVEIENKKCAYYKARSANPFKDFRHDIHDESLIKEHQVWLKKNGDFWEKGIKT